MLSIVKLDSSIFNNFTSTLTISGGSPYQIPFDDIPSDAELFCLYNITGDVANKSLTQTLALSALNSFNNNTLNGSFFDINAKSISLNQISASRNNLRAIDFESNSLYQYVYTGYYNVDAHFLRKNTYSSFGMVCVSGYMEQSDSFTSIQKCDINDFIISSNTFNKVNVLNLDALLVQQGKYSSIGMFNCSAQDLTGIQLSYVPGGNLNVSYAGSNTISEFLGHAEINNLFTNTLSYNFMYGKINSLSSNSISENTLFLESCDLKRNKFSRGLLNVGVGRNVATNTISRVSNVYLGHVIEMKFNTCGWIYNMKVGAASSFYNNELGEINNFEYSAEHTYYHTFSGNTIQASTVSFKTINSSIFTDNSLTINEVLDFNYGSSNVYDSNLHYLLDGYVDESKVLGKYNLIPYLRNLNNKGNITFGLGIPALDAVAEGIYSSNSSSLCPEFGAHYNYIKHYGRIYTSTGIPNSFTYHDVWEVDFNAMEANHNNNACENFGLWSHFSASLAPYSRVFYYTYPSYKIRPPTDCYSASTLLTALNLNSFIGDSTAFHFSHTFDFTSANTSFSTIFTVATDLFTDLEHGTSLNYQLWTHGFYERSGTF
jgi:hypothetical protein